VAARARSAAASAREKLESFPVKLLAVREKI
jgi:hypothetical protein